MQESSEERENSDSLNSPINQSCSSVSDNLRSDLLQEDSWDTDQDVQSVDECVSDIQEDSQQKQRKQEERKE